MRSTIVPDVIRDQTVRTLSPEDTARSAARLMTDHDVSAIIVVDAHGALAGIVTERDLSRRVVAEDRRGSDVSIAEIMTADPVTVGPDQTALEALEKMRALRIRHLPVVADRAVVGIVSIRDLQQSVSSQVVTV